MTLTLEIQNELESYEVLKALIERKEKMEGFDEDVECLEGIIEQFEGYNSYSVLVKEN